MRDNLIQMPKPSRTDDVLERGAMVCFGLYWLAFLTIMGGALLALAEWL